MIKLCGFIGFMCILICVCEAVPKYENTSKRWVSQSCGELAGEKLWQFNFVGEWKSHKRHGKSSTKSGKKV